MDFAITFNKIFKHYKIDFFLNFILICFFLFSQNFLEEDIIIGICSYTVLLSIFFLSRETIVTFFKKLRKDIKNFFVLQNKFHLFFNYLYVYFFDKNLSFVRRTFYRTVLIKTCTLYMLKKIKFVFFKTKFLFLKILILSLLNKVFN